MVRWEKLYFNPFPDQKELEALANLVMVDVERLQQMFPNKGMITQPKPIMLCAACYQEVPCHRMVWQDKRQQGCKIHELKLLSKCINCRTSFPIPSSWKDGNCPHCHLPFIKMARHQHPT